jgi:hypothetical protein
MPIGRPLQILRPNRTLECLSLHSRESVLIYLFKQQLSLANLGVARHYFLLPLPQPETPTRNILQSSGAGSRLPDYTRSTPFDRRQGLGIAKSSVQLLLWGAR